MTKVPHRMPGSSAVAAVAVIGKQNNPLFLQHFTDADELKFHYIVHTSLDIVEERASRGSTADDMFLGLLCPIEDYRVYGFITNTQVKLIVVLEEVAVAVREAEVKIFMERFHRLYVDTMSNPFVEIGAKITSKQFKAGLQQLLSQGR